MGSSGAKKFDVEELLPFHLVEHARDLRKLRGLPEDNDVEIYKVTLEDQAIEISNLESEVEQGETTIKSLEAEVRALEDERSVFDAPKHNARRSEVIHNARRSEVIAVGIVAWAFVLRERFASSSTPAAEPPKKKRAPSKKRAVAVDADAGEGST